jgi:molybdopterin synthase catalytic subunit
VTEPLVAPSPPPSELGVPGPNVETWLGLSSGTLPVAEALTWVVAPHCGAVVTFVGTVRDRSDRRPGVTSLEYEAYAEQVEPRLVEVAAAARRRWPGVSKVALLHRVGLLAVGEAAVVVAVSTPSRDEAFTAARYCIDTLKATVPIWKKETWDGGSDWVTCDHDVVATDG